MKKIIALLLIAVLVFTGCSKKTDSDVVSDTSYSTSKESSSYGTEKPGSSTGGLGEITNHLADALFGEKKAESTESSVTEAYVGGPADAGLTADYYFTTSDSSVYDTAGDDRGSAFTEEFAYGTSEGFAAEDDCEVEPWIEPAEPWIEPEPIRPQAGLLTAGEWNDNKNFSFLRELLANGQNTDYKTLFTSWGFAPFNRVVVHVTAADGTDLENAKVCINSDEGGLIWTSVTDNKGMAYAYYNVLGAYGLPSVINIVHPMASGAYNVNREDLMDNSVVEISVEAIESSKEKQLDLMFVVDTTGSMGDEIYYLQAELEDVIKRVKRDNGNISTELSVNFYRDFGDDYVVRSYPFSSDIDKELSYLCVEYADGGGDYEEAVDLALLDAINEHEWRENSTKLMFMVLDAPPHMTDEVKANLAAAVEAAAAKGIRIIPVASSGVDDLTEFLLRTLAMTSGGTYTFLTDDSGIGGSHLEPTVGSYEVEQLNDMLVRIINSYLD